MRSGLGAGEALLSYHLAGPGANIAAGAVLVMFLGLMTSVAIRCFRAM